MTCKNCGKNIIKIHSHTDIYTCDSMPRLFSFGGKDTAITVDGAEVDCDLKAAGKKKGVGYIKHECKKRGKKNDDYISI